MPRPLFSRLANPLACLCVGSPRLSAQCELDIMFNLEKAHYILDEMVMNGCIIETNKNNVLAPIQLLDKTS